MTSSRLEPPTHTTGAHRGHRRAPRPSAQKVSAQKASAKASAQQPPARYEPYLDGLFTYCLSVLCDHDAATALLGDVLAIAERQYGRCPSGEAERRAWLYALARWACLRRLADQRRERQGTHTGRPARPDVPEEAPRVSEDVAERRRGELALLAWPEAAGTTPEQREALELAVRHGLGAGEVASVLGLDALAARELLAAAACEVERTRAALAVVERGNCPAVARLTEDHRVLLSAALRQELVRHVDDCPRCRRAAERAGAGGPWPGSSVTPAALPLVEAPRAAAYIAMLHVPRARAAAPRFGPGGFPLDPKDHAARRDRLRARAVTTTVVATVVAAPVLALWAAYRGAPQTGEGHDGSSVTVSEADSRAGLDGEPYDYYENAGNARAEPDPRFTAGMRSPDVSVEVISAGTSSPAARPGVPGPGRITVEAEPAGDTTSITLRASGASPVAWSLWTDAPWLYVSRSSGTLRPGESVTIYVTVDHGSEPAGEWSARVGVDPSGAVLEIDGYGATPTPTPSNRPPTPAPADPTPTPADPTPTPSDPSPAPADPTPSDSAPPPSDPPPGDPSSSGTAPSDPPPSQEDPPPPAG
ncbi:BACON domain-containing protein [Streptomyces sp. SLBN-118]|uniref:BACON domain-containing protein n=1 Tax=Streptomyces sp. SLBN-118 TaxID=2768454 RepID=UPI00114F2F4E|nr:sigma-70 family RNA polymerase sigma factor [Streptomyces sp. SLBN-118]